MEESQVDNYYSGEQSLLNRGGSLDECLIMLRNIRKVGHVVCWFVGSN